MPTHRLADLLARRHATGEAYLEFLRAESMSVGLYVLPAGGTDHQLPHTEDEVYVVLAGRGRFICGDETRDVAPGDTIFVPAHLAHRFQAITGELQLIVVFAPPEYTRQPGPAT